MLEHIKDFLYDLSDIIVSLIIIALIFVSVSWKISDTLSVDLTDAGNNQQEEPIVNDNSDEDDSQVIDIIPDDDSANLPDASDSTGNQSGDQTADNSSNADDQSNDTSDSTPPADTSLHEFIVPAGASGYSIGKDLVSQGYVDSENTFVNRLVERDLDRKLFAGTFKLSKADDLDTIINVLTGQGR